MDYNRGVGLVKLDSGMASSSKETLKSNPEDWAKDFPVKYSK